MTNIQTQTNLKIVSVESFSTHSSLVVSRMFKQKKYLENKSYQLLLLSNKLLPHQPQILLRFGPATISQQT